MARAKYYRTWLDEVNEGTGEHPDSRDARSFMEELIEAYEEIEDLRAEVKDLQERAQPGAGY